MGPGVSKSTLQVDALGAGVSSNLSPTPRLGLPSIPGGTVGNKADQVLRGCKHSEVYRGVKTCK